MKLLCHEFGRGHLMRLKITNFETLYILFFEATRPWDALWYDSNTEKWGTSWGARVRGTSQICMVLHDIMRCLILCIPLQEPNKIKNEVPQKFEKTMMPRDAVPRHHVMPRQFWSKLLGIIFSKKGALFLSLSTCCYIGVVRRKLTRAVKCGPIDLI